MGRLVQAPQLERVMTRGGGVESATATKTVTIGGDSYQDRLAKYIPGEVIAAYLALDRTVVPSVQDFKNHATTLLDRASSAAAVAPIKSNGVFSDPGTQHSLYMATPVLILIIGLIFTPLYIRQLAQNSGAQMSWRTQAVISTLAFLVWAYAIQGSAFMVGYGEGLYFGNWASALVIIFTLASGLFTPPPAGASSDR